MAGPEDLAKRLLELEDEVDGRLRQRGRLLGHGGDMPVRGNLAVASLRMQLAAQQRE